MVRGGERQQVDDQQQIVIVGLACGLVVPAHDQPEDERDRQQTERVHLLVHDRLIPHRERRGRHDCAGEGGQTARPRRRHDRAQPAFADEKPAARGHRARHGGEEVDAFRVTHGPRNQSPHVRDQREQRIAGWMRNAEGVGGGDVFRRVPELRRGGEREDVQNQRAEGYTRGHEIRRINGG